LPKLEFRILGPVEVWRDGRQVPLRNGVLLSVLAGLLVSVGEAVSPDTLVKLVWGDRLPEHPRAALHNVISRLRRLVDDGSLETLPSGYRLRSDADHLDLLRFNLLLASATAAENAGAFDTAIAAIEEALDLWRDPLLGNVEAEVLVRVAIRRLTERQLAAAERWADLCVRLDRYEPMVEKLPGLIERHPFREQLVGWLMIALLRTGRQADALAHYDTLRRSLSEELGIDPSLALQDLYLGILRADPAVVGGERSYATLVAPRRLPPEMVDLGRVMAKRMARPESDPHRHILKLHGMLNDVIKCAREDLRKIEEPEAQALLTTAVEVCTGLATAMDQYRQQRALTLTCPEMMREGGEG
jgi:DNA-binding SARP family transcriptional activator